MLEIKDLRVSFQREKLPPAEVIHGVSVSLERGETLGIVGESGSGKSVLSLATMGLLPQTARATGQILFEGGRGAAALGPYREAARLAPEFAPLRAALAPLCHARSWAAVAAERAVSRAMGGSCSMPLAAYTTWGPGAQLHLQAAWGDPDGRLPVVRVSAGAEVKTLADAEALGLQVVHLLKNAGATAYTPASQPASA